MWRRALLIVVGVVALCAGGAAAQVDETIAEVVALVPGPSDGSVIYSHGDCINPVDGSSSHIHTAAATPFFFNGEPISFAVTPMAFLVDGQPCAIPLFTGAYNLKSQCGAGTWNPGATNLSVRYDFVGGRLSNTLTGPSNPCVGPANGSFTLDVTVDIRPGVIGPGGLSSPPAGGVMLEVAQDQP